MAANVWDNRAAAIKAAIDATEAAGHPDAETGQLGFSQEWAERLWADGDGVILSASNPGVGDDSNDGHAPGVLWINTTTKTAYVCTDAAVGAAQWEVLGGGAGSGVQVTVAASNPDANDDSGTGQAIGDLWVNTTSDEAFVAVDVSVAAAIWPSITNPTLANMAQSTVKGRAAGSGTGTPVDLSPTQLRVIANVEDGATADQDKADIDALNIDADTVDGQHAAEFAAAAHNHDATDLTSGILPALRFNDTAHGNRGGGALHADVVAAGADGFMTGADKTKLDGLPSAPIMASDVEVLEIGTATYDDVQDFINLAWSAGQLTGGEVTDGGSETVDCAAIKGTIRDADSVISDVLFFDTAADNLAIPTGTTKFVRINYNAGTPIWELSNNEETDREDIIHMAKVTNDGGVLHISSLVDHAGNIPSRLSHTLKSVFGVRRTDNDGGIMLAEGGTRYITVTAGKLFYGTDESTFTDKDTNPGGGADTFATEYFNGSVWVTTTGVSQWPNEQYNNIASGLVTMTNNRWAVLWFYAETDDDLSMIYGSAQYVTQALAELETVPISIPDKLFEHGILIRRLVFKKSAAIAEVESAFIQAFVPTTVISHIELPDLTTGDAGHTQFPLKTGPFWEQIKAGFNMSGGGTISLSAGGVFKWTARFIVITNGNGSHFSTAGYFDINMPTSGTLTGVGGAGNQTWTAAGMTLSGWQALYYILPIGSASTSIAANFRVAYYTSDLEVPANWILLAILNNDPAKTAKVGTGIHLGLGESRTNNSINAKVDGIEALAEVNNISDTDATDLTDGGATTLHSHAAGAGAGDLIHLAAVAAAGDTYVELDLSALSAGDYIGYIIEFDKLQPLTDGHSSFMQAYQGGAYRTDALYMTIEQAEDSAGAGNYSGGFARNAMQVAVSTGTNTGWQLTSLQEHSKGTIRFGDLLNTVYVQGFNSRHQTFSNIDRYRGSNLYGTYYGANAGAWTKVRFFTGSAHNSPTTNGVVTGEFKLYGIQGA